MMARHRRQRGMTLIEVTFVVISLTVALAAVTQSMATGSAARYRLERQALALDAVRDVAETVRATPIDDIVGTFGAAGDPGERFSIPGLDGEELAGRILIISDETLTDQEIGMTLGMPRDLDGDGAATNTDVTGTALVIPVIVEARWGPAGNPEVLRLPLVVIR